MTVSSARSWLAKYLPATYQFDSTFAAFNQRGQGLRQGLMPKATFNIRLWFAVGSLGSIVLICAAAAFWLNSYLTDSLIDRESQVSQEFLETITAVNGAEMFADDGAAIPHQSEELLDFVKHALNIPGILRINIYTTTRRILWSTEGKLVGQAFNDNDELERALRGEIVADMSYLTDANKQEHVALGNVDHYIEAYMPLHGMAPDRPVVAVMEFYRLPLRLDDRLAAGSATIWSGAVAAALLLFAVLYWIVQRGAQIIERQQRELTSVAAFAAVGQMSSAVAHSLRNPMAAIRSSAELWRGQLPAENQEIADEIMRDVDRMDSYVRDLLSYARPEPYDLQVIDPHAVLKGIAERHRHAATRSGVVITLGDAAAQKVHVKADFKLLEQALTTVVTNALEAMGDGGELSITLDRSPRRGMIRLGFADTGRGIAPDVLQHVSSRYYTTKPGGLGLGLVLTRGIIERFGGMFSIASTRDVGTTVNIDIPVA